MLFSRLLYVRSVKLKLKIPLIFLATFRRLTSLLAAEISRQQAASGLAKTRIQAHGTYNPI